MYRGCYFGSYKYPEIEDIVLKEDEAVYLTKNGYGSMVVDSKNDLHT